MSRDDPQLNLRVPSFVKEDLKRLKAEVRAARASETEIVAALIHAASTTRLQHALRKYRDRVG